METLVQAAQRDSEKVSALPPFLPVLDKKHVRLERGQLCMVVAPPNGMKSAFSLWYALKAKVPTFYFSADTDRRTTEYRAIASRSQYTFDEVKGMAGTSADDIISEERAQITKDGIFFCFDPAPTIKDLDLEIQAYEEVFGEGHLQLVIVDNLLNMMTGDAGDFAGLIDVLSALHSLARSKDLAVMVLHHVNVRDGQHAHEYPHPQNAIRGRVAQYPEMILSLASLPAESQLRIACVKHRHATPSPSGEDYATVFVDAPRMTFYDSLADLKNAEKMREYQ